MTQGRDGKQTILKPYLLLCEGRDEIVFFERYREHKLGKENRAFNKIQCLNFGGINELKNFWQVLDKLPNFNIVKRIAIVRDAETNWNAAVDSLNNILNEGVISRELISSYPYFLLPGKDTQGNWQNGTLEDLCLKILQDNCDGLTKEYLLDHSKNFLNKAADERQRVFRRMHKNMLYTYFAATDKLVGQKVGEAVRVGAYNLEHEALSELKKFLTILATGDVDV